MPGRIDVGHVHRKIREDLPEGLRIELIGERIQWAEDKLTEKGPRTYVVDYVVRDGSFAVTSILEKGQASLPPASQTQGEGS